MVIWVRKGLDFLALCYAVLFFPAPIFWLIIHPAIRFWRRFGSRSFWIAVPLWIASGTVLVELRQKIFAHRLGQNALTMVLGAALVALAAWIGHRVLREFGLRRLAGIPEMNPASTSSGLVSRGIYSRLRHPRYLDYMLSFLGLALLTGAAGYFLLAFITILLYLIVVPLEERELRDQYRAQYDAYARTVPRFVPHFSRSPKALRS